MAGFEMNHDEVEKRQAAQESGEETGTLMTPDVYRSMFFRQFTSQ